MWFILRSVYFIKKIPNISVENLENFLNIFLRYTKYNFLKNYIIITVI